jgi:integrase
MWWPAWNLTHPRSAGTVKTKVNARTLPVFGDLPLNQVDADQISRWTHTLAADGLSPSSIRTYRALLGLILNAAVTDGYLPHAPTLPAPRTGRPARSSEVWLTRIQLHRLADAIEPRYRALVLTAAQTGARWSELVALRWEDFRPDLPLDDGAIAGPGRLKLRRPAISPTGREPESEEEEARRLIIHRTIALDQQAIDALLTHREQFDGRARARIFTNGTGRAGAPGQLGKQPGRDNQLESLFQQQIEELRGWFPWASISAETNTPGVEDNAGHYMALARLARYASNSL